MNKLDLAGRVAVVTGGARGIGLAVARRMVASGAAVSIWDMDPAKAEESRVALAADGTVSAQVLDLSDELAVAEATAKTLAAHGKVDILVNNAGITGGNNLLVNKLDRPNIQTSGWLRSDQEPQFSR